MNEFKKKMRQIAKATFSKKGIAYQSLNNDMHWKIGTVDFYPTTGLWIDAVNEERGEGYKSLIKYLNPENAVNKPIKTLSIEQIFDIAKKSKDKSLLGICTSIHKEIYK